MPELKIPPHPSHDLKCVKCKHWLKSERRNYILTPGGPMQMTVPVHEVPLTQQWANMAPCTYNPNWQLLAKDHWCSKFEQQISLVKN